MFSVMGAKASLDRSSYRPSHAAYETNATASRAPASPSFPGLGLSSWRENVAVAVVFIVVIHCDASPAAQAPTQKLPLMFRRPLVRIYENVKGFCAPLAFGNVYIRPHAANERTDE